MNILFICNYNQNRSKTAEELFRKMYTTRSAGLFSGKRVSQEDIDWADKVVVMDHEMLLELKYRFPNLRKPIIDFQISSIYPYNHPKLKEQLLMKQDLLK